MTEKTTATLSVPGAVLTYDVRAAELPGDEPPLLMIGCPMGAEGFTTLATHFTDRTVITYDPRGSERSTMAPDAEPPDPHAHADDLHRLVATVGGPVDVLASSGGAVNALAWLAAHPDDVRTVVAHEPPIAQILPDRDHMVAAMADVHQTYLDRGLGPGMAEFIALASVEGELTADHVARPAPDPASFGLPTEDDGSRDDPMLSVNLTYLPDWRPDTDAITASGARVVVAHGEESSAVMMGRSATALAELLGQGVAVFPSGHDGFLGGEYGQTGQPAAFAARLREVLALA